MDSLLEATVGVYARLTPDERLVLERFWNAELLGDAAADALREQAMALADQVDQAVALELDSDS